MISQTSNTCLFLFLYFLLCIYFFGANLFCADNEQILFFSTSSKESCLLRHSFELFFSFLKNLFIRPPSLVARAKLRYLPTFWQGILAKEKKSHLFFYFLPRLWPFTSKLVLVRQSRTNWCTKAIFRTNNRHIWSR